MRGDPQHFVASKVMCWVAADRGARLARDRDDHERAERWQQAADDIKAEVLRRRVSTDRGVFAQHYDTDDLDASLLLIPIMGFLPGRRRAGARHRARDRRRADQGRPRAALPGRAAPTTGCRAKRARSRSARSGSSPRSRSSTRSSGPRQLFLKLLSFAGPLLLYAEEIDTTTGRHLGNFPQAFTHLALIDAARRLIASELTDD